MRPQDGEIDMKPTCPPQRYTDKLSPGYDTENVANINLHTQDTISDYIHMGMS